MCVIRGTIADGLRSADFEENYNILSMKERKRMQIDFRRFIKQDGGGYGIRKYLGADYIDIKEWIEKRFLPGMQWDNYCRVWVIDHIVPLRMFDSFKESDLKICWNYRNLMPLLENDNLKKEGNIFFAYEILHLVKDKDYFYSKLYERILPEVEDMLKYARLHLNAI